MNPALPWRIYALRPSSTISELLRRIPDTWQTYRPDDLTQAQSQALSLLIGAGFVEHRGHGRLRMLNHPVMVEFTCTATGEYGVIEAFEKVCAAMWADWREDYDKWKQGDAGGVSPFLSERLEPSEWRLTDKGVLSRNNVLDGKQEAIDFVLKRGYFDGQPHQIPDGRIVHRKPVRGVGALVSMRKVKVDAAVTGTVNVGNWAEGADAFAKAFGGMPAKAAPTAPPPPRPEPAATTDTKERLPGDGATGAAAGAQNKPPAPKQCEHSEDYTSVIWFGARYEFTKTQAACVKLLWAEWEKGGLALAEETVAEMIGSESSSFRLFHTFRMKKKSKMTKRVGKTTVHRTWGTMIVPAGKGKFRLAAQKKSGITE